MCSHYVVAVQMPISQNWQQQTKKIMNTNSIIEIRDAKLPDDIDFIKNLWTDYLTWGNDK